VPVSQDHGVADPGRDGLGVADVKRQAGAAQPRAEFLAAQERREPAGAGEQVGGLTDDGLLEGLPDECGAGRGCRLAVGAWAVAAGGVIGAGTVVAAAR
jgi:hypothetical protein